MSGDGGRRVPGRPLTPGEEEVGRGIAARRVAALSLVEQSTEEIRGWLVGMGDVSRPALARVLGVDRATVAKWSETQP
jgi:hypothetical protein